jgi:hypothetical protein
MQNDLNNSYPNLAIELLGINQADPVAGCSGTTYSNGNTTITGLGDIPWLQDVDNNSNCSSDVWYDSWLVTWRDVVILDGNNVEVGVYNLTQNPLGAPPNANYDALKLLLINAAQTP